MPGLPGEPRLPRSRRHAPAVVQDRVVKLAQADEVGEGSAAARSAKGSLSARR